MNASERMDLDFDYHQHTGELPEYFDDDYSVPEPEHTPRRIRRTPSKTPAYQCAGTQKRLRPVNVRSFSLMLADARKGKGLSVEDLSAKARIDVRTVRNIEIGSSNVCMSDVIKYCNCIDKKIVLYSGSLYFDKLKYQRFETYRGILKWVADKRPDLYRMIDNYGGREILVNRTDLFSKSPNAIDINVEQFLSIAREKFLMVAVMDDVEFTMLEEKFLREKRESQTKKHKKSKRVIWIWVMIAALVGWTLYTCSNNSNYSYDYSKPERKVYSAPVYEEHTDYDIPDPPVQQQLPAAEEIEQVPETPADDPKPMYKPETKVYSREYEEGYDNGYDAGRDDALEYDNSNKYRGKKRKDYIEGYNDGFREGFEEDGYFDKYDSYF